MGPPVHAEIDLELVAVAGGDCQAGELRGTPSEDHLVAVVGQGSDRPLYPLRAPRTRQG